MNKLTKVGFSALCGSLAAMTSANAGSMAVTGGVDMSWTSLDGDTSGNPIGIGSNLTFKGDGELDNGWTFDVTVAHANSNAYSATTVNLTMGGLGKITIDQGSSANGIDAYDDMTPTAWEEPWGAGLSTGFVFVSGIGTSQNIQYSSPSIAGSSFTVAMSHDMGSADVGDKSNGVANNATGRGYDATVHINPSFGTEVLSGLNIYAGGHYHNMNTTGSTQNEVYEGTAAIVYALGPVEVGFGRSGQVVGETSSTASTEYYVNNHYGVAFNINDDLSVSWGLTESKKNFHQPNANEAVRAEVSSLQIAYSMGGASMRLAQMDGDNLKYTTGTGQDKDATVISLALAF